MTSPIHKVYLIEPVGEISKGNHISHIDFYNDQSRGKLVLASHVRPIIEQYQKLTQKQTLSSSEIIGKLDNLKNKYPFTTWEDIEKLVRNNNMELLDKASELLSEREKQCEKFLRLQRDFEKVNEKIKKLTERFSKGEADSEAFKTARDDLEREKKEIEEQLWKLRSKLFKEDYEKPF